MSALLQRTDIFSSCDERKGRRGQQKGARCEERGNEALRILRLLTFCVFSNMVIILVLPMLFLPFSMMNCGLLLCL